MGEPMKPPTTVGFWMHPDSHEVLSSDSDGACSVVKHNGQVFVSTSLGGVELFANSNLRTKNQQASFNTGSRNSPKRGLGD